VLLTADGLGTAAIMRRTGKSKSVVWRWQERFMQAGVDGLLRDKTPLNLCSTSMSRTLGGSAITKRIVRICCGHLTPRLTRL
jgi:hypothetical protein